MESFGTVLWLVLHTCSKQVFLACTVICVLKHPITTRVLNLWTTCANTPQRPDYTADLRMSSCSLHLFETHFKQTFHGSSNRKKFGGERWIADSDWFVFIFIWVPTESPKVLAVIFQKWKSDVYHELFIIQNDIQGFVAAFLTFLQIDYRYYY